jgi:hypothetical protein
MKIVFILIFTALFSVTSFSQSHKISLKDISSSGNNKSELNNFQIHKTPCLEKILFQNSIGVRREYYNYKIIPIPPSNEVNYKYELIPLSIPGQITFRYADK